MDKENSKNKKAKWIANFIFIFLATILFTSFFIFYLHYFAWFYHRNSHGIALGLGDRLGYKDRIFSLTILAAPFIYPIFTFLFIRTFRRFTKDSKITKMPDLISILIFYSLAFIFSVTIILLTLFFILKIDLRDFFIFLWNFYKIYRF